MAVECELMVPGMFDSGALPVLERLVQFTAARHTALADSIANLTTPNYQPRDLDVKGFQAALRRAIEQRRKDGGALRLADTREIRFQEGGMETKPQAANQNILFHDRNNRDLERTMQHLVENTMTHNVALGLIGNELSVLQMAIRGRV